MRDPDCLFCRFVAGDPTPDVVHETASTLAFRDINPQAPTHVLVVPKDHHANAAALAEAAPDVMADLIGAAAAVFRALAPLAQTGNAWSHYALLGTVFAISYFAYGLSLC